MQPRWSEDLETFLYQLLKFRAAAGVSATHHLAFFFFFIRREPERVSDPSRWKNKELCFFQCSAGALLNICNFAETKRIFESLEWKISVVWPDLSDSCPTLMTTFALYGMHHIYIFFYVFCIDLSTFNKLGNPSSFVMATFMCLTSHICT